MSSYICRLPSIFIQGLHIRICNAHAQHNIYGSTIVWKGCFEWLEPLLSVNYNTDCFIGLVLSSVLSVSVVVIVSVRS